MRISRPSERKARRRRRRDKRGDTIEFTKRWKARRAKAKHDTINRKKNQRLARRKRK